MSRCLGTSTHIKLVVYMEVNFGFLEDLDISLTRTDFPKRPWIHGQSYVSDWGHNIVIIYLLYLSGHLEKNILTTSWHRDHLIWSFWLL